MYEMVETASIFLLLISHVDLHVCRDLFHLKNAFFFVWLNQLFLIAKNIRRVNVSELIAGMNASFNHSI